MYVCLEDADYLVEGGKGKSLSTYRDIPNNVVGEGQFENAPVAEPKIKV